MKRIFLILICLLYLSGCSSGQEPIDVAHKLRSDILHSSSCLFNAHITADYGDELYEFDMQCEFDQLGNLMFSIKKPDSIAGITGRVDAKEGAFTFDDQVLAFKKITDGQLTPVTAPWVLMQAVRGGYISACGKDKDGYHIQLDESYEENPLTLDLWINHNMEISRGELLWDGRRILSIDVTDYKLQ